MKPNIHAAPMRERFDHLFAVISGSRFLKMQGLGNEVPFFICPFAVEETFDMTGLVRNLVKKLDDARVSVLEINLYDLSIEILKARGIWDQVLQVEESTPKDQFKELLQDVLDPETHLVPAIAAKLSGNDFDVLFLTGVGEVFPYIRSHKVLNCLQSTAKEKPTLMFFPGTYTQSLETGASLVLFGKLSNDKYYRAFDIYNCEA